ncbi:MAG TPA: tetratricopeptide repeat protein [Bryobacteraceae bacterium]|nr:tetratricopeptide repeat protein [Bryobacteraceae bacterium]
MTIALAFLLLSADAETLSARALERAQAGDESEAARLWQQALAVNPKTFSAAFNLGYLNYRNKRFREAEPLLASASEVNPKDFNAAYLLGVVRSQLGQVDEAIVAWRHALALQAGNRKLMRIMALEYRKGSYFREAAEMAEKSLDPADKASWQLAIRSWHDALDHMRALTLATKFAALHPDSAFFEHGYALYRNGRAGEAEPLLARAAQHPQASEEAQFFYGELLLSTNRAGAASAPLRRAVEVRPEYTAARLALARALLATGNADAAKHELTQALERDPKHAQPHLMLAQILFREGDEAGAARHKKFAAELRKQNPSSLEGAQSRPFGQPTRR